MKGRRRMDRAEDRNRVMAVLGARLWGRPAVHGRGSQRSAARSPGPGLGPGPGGAGGRAGTEAGSALLGLLTASDAERRTRQGAQTALRDPMAATLADAESSPVGPLEGVLDRA